MKDELLYTPDQSIMAGDDSIESVVLSVASYKDTAAVTCHGTGKTTMGANVLLTSLALVPELLVYQLSPTWSQVNSIFWNEIRKWYPNSEICKALFEMADKAPKMRSRIAPEKWYAEGKASNMPGRVEGKHNLRVLQIIDEAKAVEDKIVEAVEGAMTSKWAWRLKISTPSTPGGKFTSFYKCFTKNRERWNCFKITAAQSPRVSKDWVKFMYDEYGKESPIVKARVEAEFPDAGGNVLIPLQVAENFFREDDATSGAVSIGVDVARFGEDESVISVWKGMRMIALKVAKETSQKQRLTQLANEVKNAVKEYNAQAVVIDVIGVGGGVVDYLADKNSELFVGEFVSIVPFTANGSCTSEIQSEKYRYIFDELMWEFAQELKVERMSSAVDNDKLVYQLSSYQVEYTPRGIRCVYPEKKDERMGKEPSPDRAMATLLGWYGARLLIAAGVRDDADAEYEKHKKSVDGEDYDSDSDPLEPEFTDIRDKKF